MPSPRPAHPSPHLIVALATPFTAEHRVDRPSLARLVRYLEAGGVHEFFAAGSTGEAPFLDDDDRLAVIETVRAAAPGARIFAGVSSTGHRAAIRLARAARGAGADVAVLLCPYFLGLTQEMLAGYCEAVADACELPLAVYHHVRMPTRFEIPTVARLAAHPNIIALKDTSGGDVNRCAEVLAATAGRPFEFYQGSERLVLATLQAGGHGCVAAQANIAPQLYRALFDAWSVGDATGAHAAQERLTKLWELFLRPEVKPSFYHFLHTMKLPLQRRGVIATTANAVPTAPFDPAFEQMIMDHLAAELPAERALVPA
ncbi:MAG: hypothetical protein RLZZ15_2015 [Verrucomicrobiota bacterium]|jgi:4-hydroxy-tetrahydrodipicolinate synthase